MNYRIKQRSGSYLRQFGTLVRCALVALVIAGTTRGATGETASGPAQWRKGLVKVDDQWLTPEAISERSAKRGELAEYAANRTKTPQTAAGLLELANWCAAQKLPDEERAHLTQVLLLDPSHQHARKRLGFIKLDNVWISREEMQRSKERATQATRSMRKWASQLQHLVKGLNSDKEEQRATSRAKLFEIVDPGAIPAMALTLSAAGDGAGLALVDALARMTAPEASVSLAQLAIFAPSLDVRRQATLRLKDRSQDEYVPALLGELSTPLQAKVDVLLSPDGRLTFRHRFYLEGNQSRSLAEVEQSFIGPERGRTVINPAQFTAYETQISTAVTAQSLELEEKIERICTLLAKVTGLKIPADAEAWWSWWNEKADVVAEEKPVYRKYYHYEAYVDDTLFTSSDTPSGYTIPAPPPAPAPRRTPGGLYSCFVAGTPVWTITGLKAVEMIQVGDRVLAQDIEYGELAYKPVLQTTIRKPCPLLAMKLSRESLTCTPGHAFWSEGKGWTRANECQPGTALHQIDGIADVQMIEPAQAEATYNLIVADFHTYFVGKSKLLSHDVTPHRPTAITTPGEAPKRTVAAKL